MYLLASSMELVFRLRKQIDRVMDPNLLETDNIHEVKHWIEPGMPEIESQPIITAILLHLELICYGWGHYQVGRHQGHKEHSIPTIIIDEGFV